MSIKKMVTLALFTTIALTIFVIESALPPIAPIPGIKLGLANIVTLVVLVHYGSKDAFFVLMLRIILASIFAGQIISFAYSLCGGCLCLLSMCICNKLLHNKYIYVTSIIGAIFHNIGQIIIACVLLQSLSIMVYLPILLISSIITGLFTGLCSHFLSPFFSSKKGLL